MPYLLFNYFWLSLESLYDLYDLCLQAFGEKEENQEKREPVESCNHQSKVRVGLIFFNLRLYNSEIEYSM